MKLINHILKLLGFTVFQNDDFGQETPLKGVLGHVGGGFDLLARLWRRGDGDIVCATVGATGVVGEFVGEGLNI